MIFLLAGIVLILTGGLVSVAFWVPKLVNRVWLRELLGKRYPVIYVIYLANGPILLSAGLLLVWRYIIAH
ncbi:MAG: hypothetical protein KJ950_02960 [Proteobacteria bacterium]|nr:hypothetical protein [Pseudomonadota bacterium]MBU1686836.1 hypothetical protein [Pseudomonadota bacterium]